MPRAYHSGDSDEIDWILRRLKHDHPTSPICAVGVSLGGNALLKWLGERENSAAELLCAAAAVSAPVDLAACGHHLGQGFNRVYSRHFLNTLKPRADQVSRAVHRVFPPHGGHVGFVSGSLPGRIDWLPRRLLHFFEQML